jgi:hypothetical protein
MPILFAFWQYSLAMNPFTQQKPFKKTKAVPSSKKYIELQEFVSDNFYNHKGWYTVQELINDTSASAIKEAKSFFQEFMNISKAHNCSAGLIAVKKLGIRHISNPQKALELKNIIEDITASACCLPAVSSTIKKF